MVSGIVARQKTWTAAAAAKKVERKNYANTGKLKGETQLKMKERKTAFVKKKKSVCCWHHQQVVWSTQQVSVCLYS